MRRAGFLLSPPWLALHVITVVAVLVMLQLGRWQLESYDPSEASRATGAVAPSTTATAEGLPAPGEPLPSDRAGGTDTVSGQYDDEATLLVPGRAVGGSGVGWLVMTPLRSPKVGEAGRGGAVPVVRGWVSSPDSPAARAPTGEVTVTGVVATPESDRAATVGDGPARADEVGALSTQTLLLELPYPPSEIVPALLVATTETPTPRAEPLRASVDSVSTTGEISRWRHLAYGTQWWLFALAAVAFWVAFVRAGFQSRRDRPEDGDGEPGRIAHASTGDRAAP